MRKLLLAVCALVLTAGLLYGGNKWYMKRSAERWFEMYLTELGYVDDVLAKELNYNIKSGTFYFRVRYETVPEYQYEYEYFSDDYVIGIAFENGMQVETQAYLEDVLP